MPLELNGKEIGSILPHKGFMLLPEYVTTNEDSKGNITAIGKKIIWTDDHFMEVHPWAYPGVIIEEFASQVAAVLVLTFFSFSTKVLPMMGGNDGVKNGAAAQIGDELIAIVNLSKKRLPYFFFEGYVINQHGKLILQVFNIKGSAQPIK